MKKFIVRDIEDPRFVYGVLTCDTDTDENELKRRMYEVFDKKREDNPEWNIEEIVASFPKEWNATYENAIDYFFI